MYDEIVGFSKHAQACFNCTAILHAKKRYNINIAYLDPTVGAPNYFVVNSDYPAKFVKEHENSHAGWNQWKLSQHDCWTGMVVVQQHHHYATSG